MGISMEPCSLLRYYTGFRRSSACYGLDGSATFTSDRLIYGLEAKTHEHSSHQKNLADTRQPFVFSWVCRDGTVEVVSMVQTRGGT